MSIEIGLLHLGAVTSHSAIIWLRIQNGNNTVLLRIYQTAPYVAELSSATLQLNAGTDFTGAHTFTGLTAQQTYFCTAEINGVVIQSGHFHTFPEGETDTLTFFLSSCNLAITKSQRADSRRAFDGLNRLRQKYSPAFMINAGDQIYIDTVHAPASASIADYRSRYLDAWSNDNAATFFKSLPNYMILDDHELRNDYDRSLDAAHPEYRANGLKAYAEYQHSHNPPTPQGQYWFTFSYGDIEFFVLDVRTERYTETGLMCSEHQLENLLSWIDEHISKRRFVISAVPFLAHVFTGRDDKWGNPVFANQRNRVLRKLYSQRARNLVFLSGDMHSATHTRAAIGENAETVLHEFLAGPLNQLLTNGDLFYDNNNSDIHLDALPVQYRCKTYTNGLPGSKFTVPSNANTLVVRLSGHEAEFVWEPVQKHDLDPIHTIRINLTTGAIL